MNKKGQGLPMNVIIIAILVMLVLVVVGVIFMARLGFFSVQVSDCLSQPGNHICTVDPSCQTTSAGESVDGYTRDTTGLNCKDLDGQPQTCCFKLGE